jgi:hypothetical protein
MIYGQLTKQIPADKPAALEIYLTTKPGAPTKPQNDETPNKYPRYSSICSILATEKDAFVSWRYFYEAGGSHEVFCIKIEYMALCAVKNVLKAHFAASDSNPTRNPTGRPS